MWRLGFIVVGIRIAQGPRGLMIDYFNMTLMFWCFSLVSKGKERDELWFVIRVL